VTAEPHDGLVVLTPQAEFLDASNTKAFKTDVAAALSGQSKVIMDLHKVTFLDSSGCGAILSILKQLNAAGGDLKLCAVTKPVRAMFELVRMHRILDICNTREEAVKAFQV
jgi:anti-sigma B factor antagonist